VVITFWGRPRRRIPGLWLHQCGSVAEARAAHAAGADALIVQGVEAGGHVRGTAPALELLEKVRGALPGGYPILVAGGIARREDVVRALDAGAVAAVAGTRFLLAEESAPIPSTAGGCSPPSARSSPSSSALAGRRPTASSPTPRPNTGSLAILADRA
jgi:nitronate monooxygenase